MKNTILFTLVLLLVLAVNAQPKEKIIVSATVLDQNTAHITDSMYAYKYETSNSEYRQFLVHVRSASEELYLRYLWDTAGWNNVPMMYNSAPPYRYHRHPAFSNCPAVNVSYDAAIEYCKWLTDLYNADPDRSFKKVVFTLPTQAEWIQAARGGDKERIPYPWGYYLFDNNGKLRCNIVTAINEYMVRDTAGRTVEHFLFSSRYDPIHHYEYQLPVNSYEPSKLGLYNLCGNAAEMVLEKGISKGGGFASYGGEVRIDAVGHYKETSAELGFRVFMKIIEKWEF